MTHPLAQPLTLPCGAVLSNRLCKAAMSEGMADAQGHATPRLMTLYRRWAQSGAGLLLTGNIQVDRNHLERPANVVVDDDSGAASLAGLAAAGRGPGVHFWAQLSHTGRQVDTAINTTPLSPSNVEIEVIRGAGWTFSPPVEMNDADIEHAIGQFAFAARQVQQAGFTGLQLHGAHGYLISQFLSALSNRRTDRWGGSMENRARFLLAVIDAVREAVGPGFPIGLKLNASDFQKGGFSNAECVEVVKMLNGSSLDLLELSGGSLEQPKLVGLSVKEEGLDGVTNDAGGREAYFVALAGTVKAVATMPVMVTGGFRTVAGMVAALEGGELDVVGLGRPLIADPRTPAQLLAGEIAETLRPEASLNVFHILGWFNMQLERLADGLDTDLTLTGEDAVARFGPIEQANLARLLDARGQKAA